MLKDKIDSISETVLSKFDLFNKGKQKEPIRKHLTPGDVIGISRSMPYEHYAVYVGNNRVVHYTGKNSMSDKPKSFLGDFKGIVLETGIEVFLQNQKGFFILDFPPKHGRPDKIKVTSDIVSVFSSCIGATVGLTTLLKSSGIILPTILNPITVAKLFNLMTGLLRKVPNYNIYSPKETIERAKGKINDDEYNILTNNCEHFAIWCKTGINESHQVKTLLSSVFNWMDLLNIQT